MGTGSAVLGLTPASSSCLHPDGVTQELNGDAGLGSSTAPEQRRGKELRLGLEAGGIVLDSRLTPDFQDRFHF